MGDYEPLPINDGFFENPKQRRNCLRRKVCCKKVTVWQLLLTILIVIAATLLVAYFILVPNYIQKIVNRTDLSFVSVMMRNITNSTISITAQGTISAAGPFTASIFPAKNFSISYQDIPLGYMDLPQIHAKGGHATQLFITEHTVTITNSSHFVAYASDLLNNAQANWDLDGHVDVTVWHIPFYNIKFRKTVVLTGMNGLAGTQVESFSLPGDGPGYLKVAINASIFNPSFVSMQIGDMSFDVSFLNQTIGSMTAHNITLFNGTNYYAMTGVIRPLDSSGLEAVNIFVNQYISGVGSTVSVIGTGGSASAPPWLNSVLQTLQMTTSISGLQNLTLISNISLSDIAMILPGEPGDTTDSGLVNMTTFALAGYSSPFPDISILFETLDLTANMLNAEGEVMGTFTNLTYPVFNQSASVIGFQMTDAVLQITNRQLFMALVETIILNPTATFVLTGTANAVVNTQIGYLLLENVSMSQVFTINGVNGFANNAVQIIPPNNQIVAGYPWGFDLLLNIQMLNPSSAAMQFSTLSFDILYKGVFIGNGTSWNVSMVQGENYFVVHGMYVQPNDLVLQREFMSAYLQGNGSQVTLIGNSYNIPLTIPAMAKLNVSVIFPGNDRGLVAWTKLLFPPAGAIAVFNPIMCPVFVASLSDFRIYLPDWKFLTSAEDTKFNPLFEVPPQDIVSTDPIKMKISEGDFYLVFHGYIFGNHTLLATGVVEAYLDNFGPILVDAQQNFTLVGF